MASLPQANLFSWDDLDACCSDLDRLALVLDNLPDDWCWITFLTSRS